MCFIKNFLQFINTSILTFYIGVIAFKLYYAFQSYFYVLGWISVAPFIIYLVAVYLCEDNRNDLPINLTKIFLYSKNNFDLNLLIWLLFKYIFYVFIVPIICFYLYTSFNIDIFFIISIVNKIIIIYLYVLIAITKNDNDKK